MNGKPHVHEVQVLQNNYRPVRYVSVIYGDTQIHFHPPINLARRAIKTERMIKKAIRKHDDGSKREAAKAQAVNAAVGEANAKLRDAARAEADLRYKYRYLNHLTEKQLAEKAKAEQNIKWASELIK